VIWYQGSNTVDESGDPVPVSTFSLTNAGQAIRDLLARGGRMYLQTMNAIGEQGAFEDAYALEVLGVEEVELNPDGANADDTNFYLKTRYYTGQPTWFIEGRGEDIYGDVRVMGSFWGVELFTAAPTVDVLYEIPDGIVSDEQQRRAVATRRSFGAGKLVYMGFPLSRCSFEQRHTAVIRSILRQELALP
jgi:hypothetical protein